MENLQPAAGDSAALNSARARLDALIADNANVVIVVRPNASSAIKKLIDNAAAAAPARVAVVVSSLVLGPKEAQFFGNDASVVAVILRKGGVVDRIKEGAGQFVINRAMLGAEAV
jgi:hypothetical protein